MSKVGTIQEVTGLADFALTTFAMAVRGIYGVVGSLNDFVDAHIDSLKGSSDPAVERVGRLLEGAKRGAMVGYVVPVILMAAGQLLLGNAFGAVTEVVRAATLTNPVASTCAAIGAIWFGWGALGESEQLAVLQELSRGFALSVDFVQQVIRYFVKQCKDVLGSKELVDIKRYVVESASSLGRSLYSITRKTKDLIYSATDEAGWRQNANDVVLMPVLKAMDRDAELEPLLTGSLRVEQEKVKGLVREGLERRVVSELLAAASYSLPGAKTPSYDDLVRIVARQLKLPTRAELGTVDLERAILFNVMERSLERMSDEQKRVLAKDVSQSLQARGIHREVGFAEVLKFVKFAGMDVGGTLGSLAMAAPGLSGVIGLNALQFIVLKGIIISSGYVAAGGALLGFGFGGAMLAMAGAAGPIGIALGLLYTAYTLSGPAFRKLIPAICVIAAKRIEMDETKPAGSIVVL